MSQIIKLDNPYRRWERKNLPIVAGQSLAEIRGRPDVISTIPIETDAVIAINGHIIPIEQWGSRRIRDDDYLLIAPRVAAFIAAGSWASAPLWMVVAAIATQVAIYYAIGVLINSLSSKPKRPSPGFDEAELSQSFGWNPATLQRQGLPVPRFYGLNKMHGNVIAAHTEITGAATNLLRQYALISLGTGPYRDVVIDGTMKLNDQLVENFDDVFYEIRRGNLRQARISYFDKTFLEVAPGGAGRLVVNGSPITYETHNANFDNLEIDLAFPAGLYDASGGGLANNTVNQTIEIKKTTASAWQTLVTGDITDDTTKDLVIRTYKTDGTITIERGYNYQVRVTKNTAERDSVSYGDDLYIYRVREVIDKPFTYPRRALVGIKALATDQLSGTIRFSCYSRGLYVRVYENSTWTIKYSNNPAWVICDILTQPVYSGEHSPWLDLKLLLNFNGADAATETVDDSSKGHTINFTGTAQLDTAEKKFGTASLLLDGDSDDVNIANSDDWNIFENIIDDWTIDIEVKFADHAGTELLVSHYESSNDLWYLAHIHGTGLVLKNRFGGVDKVLISVIAGEITDTNFHHIAVCKVGADIGLYLDETQVGYDLMVAGDADVYDGSLFIGQQGNGSFWSQCHFDHIRIIKSNIFSAAPNSTPDDTITVPTEEYTDPGNSFSVARYDGYNPSKLNTSDFEDLADWCDDIQVNPINFIIESISKAAKAIIGTRSKNNLMIGDKVVFRDVENGGMVELIDGTAAEIIQKIDDETFSVDIDTSGYTDYELLIKLLYHFEGIPIMGNLCLGASASFNILFQQEVGWHTTAGNVNDDNTGTKVGFQGLNRQTDTHGKYESIIEFAGASEITRIEYKRYWKLAGGIGPRGDYEKVYLYYGSAWNLVSTQSYSALGESTGTIIVSGSWSNVTKIKIEVSFHNQNGPGIYVIHYLYELRAFGTIGSYSGDGAVSTLDSSPQGHDAGPSNFIGDAQIDSDQSKWGGTSLLSDGTGDHIELPASPDWEVVASTSEDWTIDFWVRHADHAGTEVYLAINSTTDYWALQHVHGSGLQFLNKIADVTKLDTGAAGEITDTNWHHIAFIKVGVDVGGYLDGAIKAHDTMVAGDEATYNDSMTIMGRGTSDPFQGNIDELRIVKSNPFGAAPDAGLTDTITIPTGQHSASLAGTVEKHLPRFAFNGGFDTESNMWKAAISVCELCRSMLVWKGNQISVIIDKSATAVYAYTVGNIIAGSFKITYLPLADRASEIEAHYRDAQKDYERQPFTLYNADIDNPTQKVRLDLFGITDADTAQRLVNHKLLMNKLLKKKVSFEADIDAIGNIVGDVVKVQHDVTNWGRIGSEDEHYTGGGRIVKAEISGSDTVITIAGQIKFDDADWRGGSTTYKIMVKTADDIPPEIKTITGFSESSVPGGTYDITAEGTFTTLPAKDDLWAAGVENLEAKDFRITDMEMSDDKTIAITGIEYVEAIYAND